MSKSRYLRNIVSVGVLGMFGLMSYMVITKPIPQPNPNAPTAFIEAVTGKCLTAYEPARDSFHACWPVVPKDANLEVLPEGTTALDIFESPDSYVPKKK